MHTYNWDTKNVTNWLPYLWNYPVTHYYEVYLVLKSHWSFGKWWKLKFSLRVLFINRVTSTSSKSPTGESFCLRPSIFWENCIKLKFWGYPQKFYYRVINACTLYIVAPSSGHILFTFNMPIKLILRRFEVVFWCLDSGVRMLHFLKDWWKFIQIHQHYMALTYIVQLIFIMYITYNFKFCIIKKLKLCNKINHIITNK